MEEEQKMIMEKITDCRRFGMMCLSLSTFLYMGMLIPGYGDVEWKAGLLACSSFLFLILSFVFYRRSAKLNEKI
ncbi:YrhC family protein [Sporolactobacillus sp. CPB3-1]|uniref:YrhC family protein n=1 Tax=Sporolactobacillus mangiferae TaxID=2940498 RepID=A0ABT0M6F5_9BACL|nr:YrhC family protein [Sporolactobacillus mangiferae]MCL1630450.1 YrhC family protein [Sporolactobacillus mangiferae]